MLLKLMKLCEIRIYYDGRRHVGTGGATDKNFSIGFVQVGPFGQAKGTLFIFEVTFVCCLHAPPHVLARIQQHGRWYN